MTRTLNYPGKVPFDDVVGKCVGPNMLGETLTVTSAEYEENTDVTVLTLVYGTHPNWPERGDAENTAEWAVPR